MLLPGLKRPVRNRFPWRLKSQELFKLSTGEGMLLLGNAHLK